MEKGKCWKVVLHMTDWQYQHFKRLQMGLSVLDLELADMDDLALSMGMDPVTLADCLCSLNVSCFAAYSEEVR